MLLAALATLSAFAALADDGLVRHEVAGSSYEIPKEWLFDVQIPWLPAPEKDSFTFLLEPNKDADKIPPHRVLVERLDRYCPGHASQMLRVACGLEKTSVKDGPPYEKVQDRRSSWASNVFSVENGKRRQIAYCQKFEPNPAKPVGSTSCTTFWAHGNLMLSFSFDHRELREFTAMKRRAMVLLEGWKVR